MFILPGLVPMVPMMVLRWLMKLIMRCNLMYTALIIWFWCIVWLFDLSCIFSLLCSTFWLNFLFIWHLRIKYMASAIHGKTEHLSTLKQTFVDLHLNLILLFCPFGSDLIGPWPLLHSCLGFWYSIQILLMLILVQFSFFFCYREESVTSLSFSTMG